MAGFAPSFAAPFKRRRRSALKSTIPVAPAAPDAPSTPVPTDAGTAIRSLLSWVSARATKFDVYLDTVNPPLTIVVPKVQSAAYVPTLLPSTTYYWKVVAFNDGGSATGPVWSFTTPRANDIIFTLAGAVLRGRFDTLSVHEVYGPSANTGALTLGIEPQGGQSVQVGLGSLDAPDLIFGGEIIDRDQTYFGKPGSDIFPVTLIDHAFRLNKRRPFGTWVETSASVIGRYLAAVYASDFTTNGIVDDLPAVSINFDGSQPFSDCFNSLAKAINGRAKVDYARDLKLFITSTATADPIDAAHPPLNAPPLRFTIDHSQLRTGCLGKGHGENTPTDVAAGDTCLPVADAVMFNPAGGMAIVATTAAGAQTTIITYKGVQLGGGGSLIGSGAAPSVQPSVGFVVGSGLAIGKYKYAYTFVTPSGESLPSPFGIITTDAVNGQASVSDVAIGSGATTSRNVYRTQVNGDQLKLLANLPNNTSTFLFNDNTPDASLGANAPTTDTSGLTSPAGQVLAGSTVLLVSSAAPFDANGGWATLSDGSQTIRYTGVGGYFFPPTPMVLALVAGGSLPVATFRYAYTDVTALGESTASPLAIITTTSGSRQVSLNGVAQGPGATLTRNVYRTEANGSQLKLLGNLPNNTATFLFNDNTPDGSLGAIAPVLDTSGLNQSALTGIPATGPGSITTTVRYGSTALPAPALTGINEWNGIPLAMAKGSAVHIFVRRDDLEAQAALGALELDEDGHATDGVREYPFSDGRFGEDLLIAACDADLATFSRPIVSTAYTTDRKSHAGDSVPINLTTVDGPWGMVGDFTILSADLSFTSGQPRWAVKASSVAFTLSDLRRRTALLG